MSIANWLNTHRQDSIETESANRYWLRTPMGLESIVLEEIGDKLSIAQVYQSHRNVFVYIDKAAGSNCDKIAANLRTPDDVYRYIGCCRGIDNTKQHAEYLITYFQEELLPLLAEYQDRTYIRLTLSFVGRRNFNRFFVENRFNDLIATHTDFTPLSNEEKEGKKAGELRLRCHIEDDVAFIGIGLQDTPLHRRDWRNIKYTGQLHTPIAACMVQALAPKGETMIIDPFCGSGTILIESAIQYPKRQHLGYDVNMDAIKIARESAALAGAAATFQLRDSLKCTPDQDRYYLISNPPWDEKHAISGGDNQYFIQQLVRWIARSTGAILLLPEEMVVALRKSTELPIRQLAQTRVRGKLASIVRIDSV